MFQIVTEGRREGKAGRGGGEGGGGMKKYHGEFRMDPKLCFPQLKVHKYNFQYIVTITLDEKICSTKLQI
jgi:hypothetical protein